MYGSHVNGLSNNEQPYPLLAWVLGAIISIVTTGTLMKSELHFPLHLLTLHLAVALVLQLYHDLSSSKKEERRTWDLRDWRSINLSPFILSLLSIPLLVNGYKAIALSNDLPNVILILTLDWQPVQLFEKIIARELKPTDMVRYLVFGAGLYLICVCNYRLSPVPLGMSLSFLGYLGLAQIVSQWRITLGKPYFEPMQQVSKSWWRYWMLAPIVVVGVMALTTERINPDRSPVSLVTAIVAIFNVAVTSTLFAEWPTKGKADAGEPLLSMGDDEDATEPLLIAEDGDNGTKSGDILIRLTIAGCITAAALICPSLRGIVSPLQYLGFLISILAFGSPGEAVTTLRTRPDFRSAGRLKLPSSELACLMLAGASWAAISYFSLTLQRPALQYTDLALSPAPSPAAQFDIVLARYDEASSDVAGTVGAILQSKSIEDLNARVVIYNKNDDTDIFERELQVVLASEVEVVIESLENVGREADTYLHHIVKNWETLAHQTLFAQAEIEDLPMVLNWVDNFFVPETGFLQLSYEGRMCANCEHCGEFTDDPAVMTSLFAAANPGKHCRDLVWTFRGQFIVSGARIRANDKSMYEHLLRQLRDPGSEMHGAEYVNSTWHTDQVDSLNDPIFGFLLERFWGLLMQCSELRVGQWSPSQFSMYARPKWLMGDVPLEDVQCLDRTIE